MCSRKQEQKSWEIPSDFLLSFKKLFRGTKRCLFTDLYHSASEVLLKRRPTVLLDMQKRNKLTWKAQEETMSHCKASWPLGKLHNNKPWLDLNS